MMSGILLDFFCRERLGSSALGSSMGPALYHQRKDFSPLEMAP
jgi:hypothetical protein